MQTTNGTSLRTECTSELLVFPSFDRRKIEGSFTAGDVSSDGGLVALRAADKKLGLVAALDAVIEDPRDADQVVHRQQDLLRQRIYGLAMGYEDLNDHDTLRKDPLWQSAAERGQELASSPTLCRLENRADRATVLAMSKVLVELFMGSFKEVPSELILDFDATDDRVHGQQEGRAFHGYYDNWCFLPLYVFCGEQLLVSYLRPSNADPARHAWAILKLLVKRMRQAWPQVKIIFRGDSGFCRWRMLRWCEKNKVDYVVGLAKNARLLALLQEPMKQAAAAFAETKEKQRHFVRLDYAAQSWDRPRTVIAKAEHTEKGANPRFILTTLEGDGRKIYDQIYCARGEMENRIKEQQLGLFADRTSCHGWWANQFRLLLSSAAYLLMEHIRRVALTGTELARAQVTTIRLKMLKIGTVVLRNTRRIRLLFSSAYPHQQLFATMMARLNSA
ncbi:MAG: IS1380 family transposase [Pseudohongiellaceae bacterium]